MRARLMSQVCPSRWRTRTTKFGPPPARVITAVAGSALTEKRSAHSRAMKLA
jgi:hypothetical protein